MAALSTTILPNRLADSLRLVVVAVYAVPLVYVVATAIKSERDIVANPAGLLFAPTLDNFSEALSPDLLRATVISVYIAIGTPVLVLALGLPAAYAISRLRGRGYAVAIATLLVFQLVPAAATLIPQYRLLYQLNLLGTIPGLVLVIAAGALPFSVLLLIPFCSKIPDEVLDASEVDGVGHFRFLVGIVLPLTRNGVLVVGVLAFIGAWGEFIAAVTFMNDPDLQPLSLTILKSIGANVINYGALTATAVLASLPLLLLYLFVQRGMRSGLTTGAVK